MIILRSKLIHLFLLSFAWSCIFNLKTNTAKIIIQITDTINKTAKTVIAITLILLSSVLLSLLLLFSVADGGNLTET